MSVPMPIRRAAAAIFSALGWQPQAKLVSLTGSKAAHELWKLHHRRNTLIDTIATKWRALNLDGVVCPAHVMPALGQGKTAPLSVACSYTAAWNVLNYPAGVVPVTRQTAADEEALEREYIVREPMYTGLIKEASKGGVGLPIGVQCVTLPWADEQCLHIMGEVERAVGAGFFEPQPPPQSQ